MKNNDENQNEEKYASLRETETHVFFWGSYLSNFYESPFKDELGQMYYTSEQYFMAQKAIIFNDSKILAQILQKREPLACKKLGKMVHNFNPLVWDQHKYQIMIKACTLKFSQNPDILNDLLNTGSKILVEASPYDTIWGIGLKWDDDRVLDQSNWRGENLLGKALMDVRNNLKK